MDEETRKCLEYEEQFFGMSSRFFADSFRSFFQDVLESKVTMFVNNIKGKIFNEAKNSEEFGEALNRMGHDLLQEYKKGLDDSFEEMYSKISDVLHIPPNILTKEDLMMKNGINKNLNDVKNDNENLKGKFKSLLYLKKVILEELEEADSAIFSLECVVNGKLMNPDVFDVLPVEDMVTLSKTNYLLVQNNF